MGSALRVLMVEDSTDDLLLLIDELRRGGYAPSYTRVDTRETMRAALSEESWELVLADFSLPHFSGPAALRLLRESGLDIPFIVVSGTVTEEQAIDMMRAGAGDFILKQNLARLTPAIQRELREAQSRRERREAREALERERAFLSSAIELLPFSLIFNTPTGEVIRANQASYRFFGDLRPSSWWQRQLLHPKTGEPIPRDEWPMARAARGEVVQPLEGTFVMPDGRQVPMLAVASPVYVADELVATVVSFTDVSPLKEADRAKNRFLAVLSHELRTPLTNILGWTHEALETPDLATEALRIIQRNAEDQRRMLENLLEVSRLLHGKLDLQREPMELWALTAPRAQAIMPEASARSISIALSAPTQPLPVLGDRKLLAEVLDNVLENAIQYTPAGGHVTVRGTREGRMALLLIEDSGRGIAPDRLPHLFDLFHITPEVEQAGGGLGLGLPLARAIIDRHGGRLTVTSAGAEAGTTVTIALPLAA